MFPLKDNIPTDRLPIVTIGLIVLNVLVYVLLQRPGSILGDPDQGVIVDWGAIPYEFSHLGDQCGIDPFGSGALVCDGQ
ncbi:MAG: hypothetical protein ACEQSX_15995, partial [Baekduiaceae bacterium]